MKLGILIVGEIGGVLETILKNVDDSSELEGVYIDAISIFTADGFTQAYTNNLYGLHAVDVLTRGNDFVSLSIVPRGE